MEGVRARLPAGTSLLVLRVIAGLGAAALWGWVAGWWMPRSPVTTSQALWSLGLSVVTGGVAGLLLRSRLAIVAAPLTFALTYELARRGVDGPTVDGLRQSTYGLLAFAVGRGFHALVALVPMALGASLGAAVARRISHQPPPVGRHRFGSASLQSRRIVAGLTAAGLVVLAGAIARPARTAPIVDANGDPVPGSITELITVDVNGHELAVMIRGHDTTNPVVLFLAGGPGGSELGAMRRHLPELEQHVTVATWDQRGTGKSYDELDPAATLTLESVVADTLAVTDHLRERFGQDRIYVMGQSWGSTLGVLAVQAAPEKYEAFIGVGQMVSQRETDRLFYEDTLAWATATGRDDLVRELTRIGPPPYDSILDYETALSYEHDVYPYDHSVNAEGEAGFSENLLVEEYTLVEQVHLLGAMLDTFSVLYPQLQEIDFRRTATSLEVPAHFVQGAHEARGRGELFEQWYDMLDAPTKTVAHLDTSGHRPLFEQPDRFVEHLVETILTGR